jgi:hypothetical protein
VTHGTIDTACGSGNDLQVARSMEGAEGKGKSGEKSGRANLALKSDGTERWRICHFGRN